MAYDEGLAERLRDILSEQTGVTEKKMFGGLAFLWQGHMFCGITGRANRGNKLAPRPQAWQAALEGWKLLAQRGGGIVLNLTHPLNYTQARVNI